MKQTNKLVLISLLLLISIGSAQAESGTINVSQYTTTSTVFASTSGSSIDTSAWNKIYIDTADFNTIDFLRVSSDTFVPLYDSESTAFSIISGGTNACMCGYVTMEKARQNITWHFNTITLSSNLLVLSYSHNIFTNLTIPTATDLRTTTIADLNTAHPAGISSTSVSYVMRQTNVGGVSHNWLYSFSGSVTTHNDYVVTYPTASTFNIAITKNSIGTKDYVHYSTGEYISDSTFNTIPLGYAGTRLSGIYLNITLAGGAYNDVLINASGITIPPTSGVTITTDKTSYQRGDTLTITATNPTTSDVWLTAYGPTGIMVDILWNNKASAGSTQTWNKVITNDYPLGQYSISAATSQRYNPIVAITYFNVSLPSNTSDSLGLLWDSNIYNMGVNANIHTQGNFNTTTLTVTAPSGTVKTFTFPANGTNTTSITMNEKSIWRARYADNGNASNYVLSNTTVALGGNFFTDNQTYSLCMNQPSHICWGQNTYYQGGAFNLDYKLLITQSNIDNPRIEITDPSQKVIFNQSINGSFDTNGYFIGSFGGTFSNTAPIGAYYARLYVDEIGGYPHIIKAEGYTTVVPSNASVIPVNTAPTTADLNDTAMGLFMLFAQIAFYGLVIFVGVMFALVKAGVNGSALMAIGALVATFEALAGLFGGYGIYVIIITWVIAAVYFRFGRDMTTGGN